jgi:hypothetical protein
VKVVVIVKVPPKIGSGIATAAWMVTVAITSSVPSGLVHVVDPATPLKASPALLQADAKEGRREACPLSAAT